MKLTKRTVDAIKHPDKGQCFCWDDELAGFGLRVTPTRKTYIVQRRVAGRTVRVTLAQHGAYTPDQARKAAQIKLGEMAGGTDHNVEKKKNSVRSVTLHQAYTDYMSAKRFTPNTLRDYRKAIEKGFADWKEKPVADITRAMVERRFNELSKVSNAQANQMFRFLRALLNYAMERYSTPDGEPLMPSNPCNRLTALKKWHRIDPRKRYIEPEKLKAWFEALEHNPHDSTHRNMVRDLCALLILTGLREQEGASLQWHDVDLVGKRITIRNTKNHQVHVLPIGNWLAALLERRRSETGISPFVFPTGNASGHIKHHRKDILALCEQSGIEFRLHDLRRTFASIVNHHLGQSLSVYTVKKLLNHATSDVTAGYIQFGTEDLREPMQQVENFALKCAGIFDTAPILSIQQTRDSASLNAG
jgi:integrase